ncbi:hypothetical protein HSX11_07395 [Oxalobacteraceae bacterium]|nr:hypothetical protein [Oxalobacteraceae bacterium]
MDEAKANAAIEKSILIWDSSYVRDVQQMIGTAVVAVLKEIDHFPVACRTEPRLAGGLALSAIAIDSKIVTALIRAGLSAVNR